MLLIKLWTVWVVAKDICLGVWDRGALRRFKLRLSYLLTYLLTYLGSAVLAVVGMSVCPSVCPSVTRWYSIKRRKI